MATQIKIRRGNTIDWNELTPVLAEGEFGYDIDNKVLKIGDGYLAWDELSAVNLELFDTLYLARDERYTNEMAQDAMASLFAAGSHVNVTFTYDDAGNKLSANVTVPPSFSDEQAQDAVATMFQSATNLGITYAYDDANNKFTATVDPEYIQDVVAGFIQAAGSSNIGIDVVYDDAGNKLIFKSKMGEVDTTGRVDGSIMVWNAADNKWKMVAGGGVVGTWETITAVWTYPALVENTGLSITVPTSRPSAATWTRTITAGDLATCNRTDVGWNDVLEVYASIREDAAVGTLSAELMVNGGVINSLSDAGHAAGDRGFVNLSAGVKVGDVVELRIWGSGSGGVVEWIGRRGIASNHFKYTPGGGGRYLYRRDIVNSVISPPTATQIANAPAWTYNRSSWFPLYTTSSEAVQYSASSPTSSNVLRDAMPQIPSSTRGLLYAAADPLLAAISSVNMVGDDSSNAATLRYSACPVSVTIDRLLIPTLPT